MPAATAAGISSSTAAALQEQWRVTLDGPIIASPLFARRVRVSGRVEDVVYAATEAGSVYALHAASGAVLWQRKLGTVEVPGCGAPYGVSSTGVISRRENRLYVIGATGLLHALDLGTGKTVDGWPLALTDRPDVDYVWGGLTLTAGRVYVPFASHCDQLDPVGFSADGRLVAVETRTHTSVAVWDVVEGPGNMGGIWGFGGTSVDPLTGHIWTATGNAWVYLTECGCNDETEGYAEEVVELDRDLHVIAAHRLAGIPASDSEDTDFGSTPTLFQPAGCPPLAAAHSKNGWLYVWDRRQLAGGPIWSAHIGPADLATPFIGEPSYSPELRTLIVANARLYDSEGVIVQADAVAAFRVGDGCTFPVTPTWTAHAGYGPKPPPLVVGDAVFVAGGNSGDLTVLDVRTGMVEWSAWLGSPLYAPPAFVGNEVVVGTVGGKLFAFGRGKQPWLTGGSFARLIALDN